MHFYRRDSSRMVIEQTTILFLLDELYSPTKILTLENSNSRASKVVLVFSLVPKGMATLGSNFDVFVNNFAQLSHRVGQQIQINICRRYVCTRSKHFR